MTDELDRLEEELRALVPHRPSPLLKEAIARDLDESPRVFAFPVQRWGWIAAAAAALLVIVGVSSRFVSPEGNVPEAAAPELAAAEEPDTPRRIVIERIMRDPVAVDSFLVAQHDEGPVVVSNQAPMRRVRYHYVDHYRWQTADGDTSYSVTTPRQQVVLVSMETN